ncbi:MAG: Arabinose 5-phosphate isomerase KdsD [Pseudomonadota bacterium]|jgi:arabinose-5-phosphate isomerase
MTAIDYLTPGLRTIELEAAAVLALRSRISAAFVRACEVMRATRGRVIVMGMGKSGHIGRKIAATFASTGTPAFFVHPAEASHGDFGMLTADDSVLYISNSGNSAEILTLLPMIKRLGLPLIAMTGNPQSTLAESAQVVLDISVDSEACPLDLAPTSSTTVTLVMGDALAVALLEARGFTAEDFAFSHPGGTLGRRLLLRVADVMQGVVPQVSPATPLVAALAEISAKGLGMTTVVDDQGALLGIFTDGDLRRAVSLDTNIQQAPIGTLMSANPRRISVDSMAVEALSLMEQHRITSLVVINDAQQPIGILHMHHLIKAGLV